MNTARTVLLVLAGALTGGILGGLALAGALLAAMHAEDWTQRRNARRGL